MFNPHQVTRDFEAALCAYTGAPFAVTVNSCTSALMLAVAWGLRNAAADQRQLAKDIEIAEGCKFVPPIPHILPRIQIPKRTYVSVPMAIRHAGGKPAFRDEDWSGTYQLSPLPVFDSARRFTGGMFVPGQMQCVSFHASKNLGIEQGGCILHDNADADAWLRRARFDGRTEGVAPKDDTFTQIGWHCYMNPSTAAQGLLRLHSLWPHMPDLPNDEYVDLSTLEIFK